MNKEIGYLQLTGWQQWQPKKGWSEPRSFNVFPYLTITLNWGVNRQLINFKFGFLFWNGTFGIRTLTKDEKKVWN